MKSGASDPFADDPPEPPADEETESEPESTDASAVDEQPEPEPESESKPEVEPESTDDEADVAGNASGLSKADLPLLLRRDTVKGERENVHQLFVQTETDSKARRAESELSERLDTDVYRLDAREAIYLAGMQNLEDAEEILERWGYNF